MAYCVKHSYRFHTDTCMFCDALPSRPDVEQLRPAATGAFDALSLYAMTMAPLDAKTIRNIGDALIAIANRIDELEPTTLILKARKFAKEKHGNKLDDEGINYFDAHVEHTVQILKQITNDEMIIALGYLHDTLEDTDTNLVELVENFGQHMAKLVYELTHDGQKDEYGYYFPRLTSKEAILVKFADRLSNLSRMNAWSPERQAHYLSKSHFWKDGTDKSDDDYTIIKIEGAHQNSQRNNCLTRRQNTSINWLYVPASTTRKYKQNYIKPNTLLCVKVK